MLSSFKGATIPNNKCFQMPEIHPPISHPGAIPAAQWSPSTSRHRVLCWLACALAAALAMVMGNHALGAPKTVGELYFESVGAMPGNVVTALTQDHAGFLWIGTQNGLLRYDGYDFLHFQHDPADPTSIGANYIRALWLADDGRLWIGTTSNGISIYDPTTLAFRHIRHDPANPHSLPHRRVYAILGDARGVWAGSNAGLSLLDPDTGAVVKHFRHRDDDPGSLGDNRVRDLLIDQEGDLLVSHWRGVDRLRGDDERFERLDATTADGRPLADFVVQRLFIDRRQRLWVGTAKHGAAWIDSDKGLHFLALDPTSPKAMKHPHTRTFAQIDPDTLWIGTYGGGISIVDLRELAVVRTIRWQSQSGENRQAYVSALMVDRSGLLWVGEWGGGLHKFNPASRALTILRPKPDDAGALSGREVPSVLERPNGEIWVGIVGQQIDVLDASLTRIASHRYAPEQSSGLTILPQAMQETSHGLWVGAHNQGLFHYDPLRRAFTRFAEQQGLPSLGIRALAYAEGTLWIGAENGLNKLQLASGRIAAIAAAPGSEGPGVVYSLAIAPNGDVWLGAANGLYALRRQEGRLRRIASVGEDQRNPIVVDLLFDGRDRLWISSQAGTRVLTFADGQPAEFLNVNRRTGQPPGELLSGMEEDANGNIWSVAGYVDPEIRRFTPLEKFDGMAIGQPWSTSHGDLRDGRFAFGGTNGLAIFHPDEVRAWRYVPPLVITRLTIDGQPRAVPVDRRLQLPAGTRSVRVDFSALDYSNPEKNRYAAFLRGFDPDWQEVSAQDRFAAYNNLDPGRYTLQIKGSNRLGEWSSHELAIDIHMLPFWHQTLAAKIVAVMAAALLLYLAYIARVGQLKRRERQLQREVAERTLEIDRQKDHLQQVLKEKESLFEQISHELRTPVTLLNLLLQQLAVKHTAAAEGEVLQMMVRSTHRLGQMVEDIIDLSKVRASIRQKSKQLPLARLAATVVEFLRPLARQYQVDIEVEIPQTLVVDAVEKEMALLLRNLINNAILHAHCRRVHLSATLTGDTAVLRVRDDGEGISPDHQAYIYERFYRAPSARPSAGSGLGLALVKQVVENHGGQIDIHSDKDAGCEFIIRLPNAARLEDPRALTPYHSQVTGEYFATALAPPESPPVTSAADAPADAEGRDRILVVEDEPELCRGLQSVLGETFIVDTAGDGDEGLSKAKHTLPDLILSDLRMPKMDGFELLQALKGDALTQHIPVVLLTAVDQDPTKLESYRHRADHFLQKPFDLQELLSIIRAILHNRLLTRQKFEARAAPKSEFLQRLDELLVAEREGAPASVESLAGAMKLSRQQFYRKVSAESGLSPKEYLRHRRMERAQTLLAQGRRVEQVMAACGYRDSETFRNHFKRRFGQTPKQYQRSTVAK